MLDNQEYELKFINGYGNSVAIDVALAEDVKLHYGEFKICFLGFALKLPKGYKADLKPRSSTFKNFGVIQTNGTGTIDSTYSGINDCWAIPLFRPIDYVALQQIMTKDISILDDVITIPKGTRIGQIEIVKAMDEVDLVKLNNEDYQKIVDSSRGGFGSTGV